MESPLDVFRTIWTEARMRGTLTHRNAVCVSTIDGNGFPSSRFVDLKEADDSGFVFCTSLESAKALDLGRDPKACITAWWEHVATQIRIKGLCTVISSREADAYWRTRSPDAQIATAAFDQSRPVTSAATLAEKHARTLQASEGQDIPRPAAWGGFRLRPEYVEFMQFRENRVHVRTAYTLTAAGWERALLQP